MTNTMTRSAYVAAALLLSVTAASAAEMLTDKDGISACYNECLVEWPAYMGKEGDTVEGLTLVKRTDGAMQWANDGKPLYFFKDDKNKGDMAGDGHDGVWHVIMK